MSMSNLEILEERIAGKIAFLSVSGALDAHTFERLKQAIEADLSQGVRRFVLELSRLEFIGSAGINVLTTASKATREKGGDLILLRVNPKVRQILDVLCLTSLFTLSDTRDGAIQKLGAQEPGPAKA
jgi:anti-sigma B factor antagonist